MEAGSLFKLPREIPDPKGQTCWYEDGTKPLPKSGINIETEGIERTRVKTASTASCSGVYSCKTNDGSDSDGSECKEFNVEMTGDMLSFFFGRYSHCSASFTI